MVDNSREKSQVLFVVNDSWFFCSHRLVVASACLELGYKVALAAREDDTTELVTQKGVEFLPWDIAPRSVNPFLELRTFASLWAGVRKIKPRILHLVTIKSMIHGGVLARWLRVPGVVFAISGLGQIYSRQSRGSRIVRWFVEVVYRYIFNHPNCLIFVQNKRDVELLVKRRLARSSQIKLLPGSGVQLDLYPFSELPSDDLPIVLLACRLIWDKGIHEFVQAARHVNANGKVARFVLVGKSFPTRSGAVPEDTLKAWQSEGAIEWWGHREDMAEVIAQSYIVTLPTFYGEGLPKVLLEASSAGRPIVATDWPGCNDLIEDGVNGLLVKPRDSQDLADAIKRLLEDNTLAKQVAGDARRLVECGYTTDKVLEITIASYESLVLGDSVG